MEDLLKPGHLTQLVEAELEADLKSLSLGEVLAGMKRILSRLRSHRDDCQTAEIEV